MPSKKVRRHSQTTVRASSETNEIKASLAVPLTVASITSGGTRSWSASGSNASSGNAVIEVGSLVINGGDESLTDEYVSFLR